MVTRFALCLFLLLVASPARAWDVDLDLCDRSCEGTWIAVGMTVANAGGTITTIGNSVNLNSRERPVGWAIAGMAAGTLQMISGVGGVLHGESFNIVYGLGSAVAGLGNIVLSVVNLSIDRASDVSISVGVLPGGVALGGRW